MDFIKKNWKNILLILFCVLFLRTCVKKNNYRRTLALTRDNTVICIDSLEKVISQNTVSFEKSYDSLLRVNDSLLRVNEQLYREIENLNKDIEIYKDQNTKLHNHNKKVTVIIKETKENKEEKEKE